MNKYKTTFFFITLIIGTLLLALSYNIKPILFQGDHGRDLYAFMAASNGEVAYRDYWWVYGPLTPYYYAGFFKLFGYTISSIIIGQITLKIIASMFIYLTIAGLTGPIVGLLASLWFLSFFPGFFYTFNHSAAIALGLGVFYFLTRYIRKDDIKNLFWALTLTFLLCFVKINIGFITLLCLVICVFLCDALKKTPVTKDKKLFYVITLIAVPLVVLLIYFLLVKDLPTYAIRQCLPYFKNDHPHNTELKISLINLIIMTLKNIFFSWPTLLFAVVIWLSVLQIVTQFFKMELDDETKRTVLLVVASLIIFYVGYMHEFLASSVFYRSHWAKPFSFLLIFSLIGFALKDLSYLIRILLYFVIILILGLSTMTRLVMVQKVKVPEKYLNVERGEIFVLNSDIWLNTVTDTVDFLKKNVGKDETFFAMPYEPLYYYLANQKSPTRQLIFFEHINIPEEQEHKIIQELEEKNTNYVLISNRVLSREPGLGLMGINYCPILTKYIETNFDHITTFGHWMEPFIPAWHHAIKVYRRK